jgi:hypothetical protein
VLEQLEDGWDALAPEALAPTEAKVVICLLVSWLLQ